MYQRTVTSSSRVGELEARRCRRTGYIYIYNFFVSRVIGSHAGELEEGAPASAMRWKERENGELAYLGKVNL